MTQSFTMGAAPEGRSRARIPFNNLVSPMLEKFNVASPRRLKPQEVLSTERAATMAAMASKSGTVPLGFARVSM